MKTLISTEWLEKNINNVRILDSSWHMPSSNRNASQEFLEGHILNSNFFDLDKHSEQNTTLPHMLPKRVFWERLISELGIKNSDHVIVYDNSDIISSCRTWYNFLYFGHNSDLVSVLDGGLKKWLKENRSVSKKIRLFPQSHYIAEEKLNMVLNKDQINFNIKNKTLELIDARNQERFEGLQQEPRKELKRGNIQGSKNLPFTSIVNQSDNTFKSTGELELIFKKLELDPSKKIAFTCGSGVTACILGLANSILNGKKPIIYDGSWSEYGLK